MGNLPVIPIVMAALIVAIIVIGSEYFYFDDIDLVNKKGEIEWVGYKFRIASSGDVSFMEDGFEVYSNGLATSKLLDVNMNKKIKVRVVAEMRGNYDSGEWSEFAIYISEKEDAFFDNKAGIALMGSRDHVAQSGAPRAGENVRGNFQFEWFSVENTGNSIIFEDSNGRKIIEDKNTDKSNSNNVFMELDPDKEWNIRINSHVKGEGSTEIKIREIIIES